MSKVAVLQVHGMSCEACVRHVTNALMALEGVEKADVSLEKKEAVVNYNPERVRLEQMVQAIEEEGYEAQLKDG